MLTNLRLRRATIQRQIAELQTQEAKIEGFFHGELTKIALSNKIDINNFVLDDNLEIKPKGPESTATTGVILFFVDGAPVREIG